jgi:hypothetical protein
MKDDEGQMDDEGWRMEDERADEGCRSVDEGWAMKDGRCSY